MKRDGARGLILVVVLAFVVCAEYALGGAISGSVDDTTDAGIQDVRVKAFDGGHNLIAWSTTDSGGTYTIVDLPEGTYRILFDGCPAGYLPRWYNNKADFNSSDAVVVTATSTVTGIDGTLSDFSVLFNDVAVTHWAEPYIAAIACDGITVGCTQTPLNYCPAKDVNRQQMAAFIIRALFEEIFPYTQPPWFIDVSENHQFYKYIQKMKDEGITTGCTPTEYCPAKNVNRQQMAAFIIRALYGETFAYSESPHFTDVPESHQFYKYIQKMKDEGITTGCTPTEYCPLNTVNRAQMAAFLARAFVGIPMVTVPSVVGMEQTAAEATVAAAGLTVGTVSTASSGSVPPGSVIGQSPGAGISVAKGSAVSLVISTGPAMIAVPNVVGQTEAAARAAIEAAGFIVGGIVSMYSESVNAGYLISQNPAGGTMLLQGSSVTFVLSLGTETIPPDPSTVAPAMDQTVATTVFRATQFLYTGSTALQTGISSTTIVPKRVAVIRGKVLNRDSTPLTGVAITILNHPEYGQTLSRADGMFDMVVNGGGYLTVNYAKTGYLTAQRKINTPWQDFTWLPDVVLIPLDTHVTAVDLTVADMQVARGNQMTDADGRRTATLFITPGTNAQLVLPDGNIQPITTLNIRATEYTVGPNGPEAMPAVLPPASAYTYCVELTADEVVAAGAVGVRFDRAQYFYLEDFVGFPVGSAVPTGYYDRQKGQWIASDNGRVVKILTITGGLADLDTDGDAAPDSTEQLAALGVTEGERQRLTGLYAAGQQLWRVPITHFSPLDCNWSFAPPPDSTPPGQPEPEDPAEKPDDLCKHPKSSTIECQSQVLGESVGLAGTPYRLHYQSDRTSGYGALRTLRIPLSGASIPASLVAIRLVIQIAGREFTEVFPAAPNQSYTFVWDGMDAYGRHIPGWHRAKGRIGYEYDMVYTSVSEEALRAFARIGGTWSVSSRSEAPLWTTWQEWEAYLGNALEPGLGLWSIDPHHVYDPTGSILYQGDGRRRKVQDFPAVATLAAGAAGNCTTEFWPCGEGVPAVEARLGGAVDLAVSPDGTLYIAEIFYLPHTAGRIRKVDPDGIITTVAGTGLDTCYYESPSLCGDGGPATLAATNPQRIAAGPDGSLYILEQYGSKTIRRVRPDGIIEKTAGRNPDELNPGDLPWGGDGGPALGAFLIGALDLAVGPDGNLYVSQSASCVRQIGTDGFITTFAGTCGSSGFSGDGGLATEALLVKPKALDTGPDGSLYIADYLDGRIRRVRPDGTIETAAGNGKWWSSGGDGGAAIEAGIGRPDQIAVGPDGTFYLVDTTRIRRVGTDGLIHHYAGGMQPGCSIPSPFPDLSACGLGGPAAAAQFMIFSSPIAAGPGAIYAVVRFEDVALGGPVFPVMRYGKDLPDVSLAGALLASENGREIYVFDASNRHRRTLDAFTGGVRYEFGYDGRGLLVSVADHGNLTTFERDEGGKLAALVGPYGHRTEVITNADGYVTSLAGPDGAISSMTYHDGGLLATFTDPNGMTSTFTYGSDGLLARDSDPAGGFTDLQMTEGQDWREVSLTTAVGRTTVFRTEKIAAGGRIARNIFPDGSWTESRVGGNGVREIRYADGMTATVEIGPDPRFQMAAPVVRTYGLQTPGGLTRSLTGSRTARLEDPADVLSVQTITDDVTLNGRAYRRVYDGASRTLTTTTPAGRQSVTVLDSLGRIVEYRAPGLAPLYFSRDVRGRLQQARQGDGGEARTFRFAYSTDGLLNQVTDPLGRLWTFSYDAGGRLTATRAPDGGETGLGYDEARKLVSLSVPGGDVHTFSYNGAGRMISYDPPDVPGSSAPFTLIYDLDRRLTSIAHPDGRSVHFIYDTGGRLGSATVSRGEFRYEYDATTGRLSRAFAPDGGETSLSYDGSLITSLAWTGAVTGRVDRSYDNSLRPASLSVNGGANVSFPYEEDGLFVQAGDLVIARNVQSGLVTGTTLQSAVDVLEYDAFGAPSRYRCVFAGSVLFDTVYTRDQLGRIIQVQETFNGETEVTAHEYELGGRLHEVSRGGSRVATYTYDPNGNRLTLTDAGGNTTSAAYDAQDRLISSGAVAYTYRADGSLASRTQGTSITLYEYDEFGNLVTVSLPDGRQISYVIDGRNLRVGKRVNGVLVHGFLYENRLRPAAELDASGAVVSRFIYGTRPNVPDYMVRSGSAYRIFSDHLGSPRFVVNAATGAVMQRLRYDAFGKVIEDTNPGFQPFGFAGGLYDRDTGFTRFGARDYDPEVGRWTAKDPLLFHGGSANLYAYVGNDPINRTDTSGLGDVNDPCKPWLPDRCRDEGTGQWAEIEQPEPWRSDFPLSIPYWGDTAISWAGWFTGALGNASALGLETVMIPLSSVLSVLAWPVAFEGARQTGEQLADHLITERVERDMRDLDELAGRFGRGAREEDCP